MFADFLVPLKNYMHLAWVKTIKTVKTKVSPAQKHVQILQNNDIAFLMLPLPQWRVGGFKFSFAWLSDACYAPLVQN